MSLPSEAVGASVGVLLYSIISMLLCLSLVGLLISYGEKWTYVTIHSCFTALSTFASIIQQIHYATNFEQVQQAKYDKAVLAAVDPGLTFVGGAHEADIVLFFIQFWCYNIMALNILFWSIALFTGSWGFRMTWLGEFLPRIGLFSKIFSFIFPSLIIGLMQVKTILRHRMLSFVVTNITMFVSLITGSVLLILTLFKYIKTRRLAAGGSRRGRWWASDSAKSQASQDIGSHYTRGTGTLSKRSSIYDRALLIRFTIGFTIMALFLVLIIVFSYVTSVSNAAVVAAGKPNLTAPNAIIEIVLFMPGVTASLVTFLVFGTAKSWRQYRDLFVGGCGIRNKIIQRRFIRQQERSAITPQDRDTIGGGGDDLEFAALPRLQNTYSEEQRQTQEEARKRVKMFSREVSEQRSVVTTTITGGSEQEQFRAPPPTKLSPGWDGRSLEASTVAGITVKSDHEYAVKPLAPRPVQQQQRFHDRKAIHFHKPRPSVGSARARPDQGSFGGSAIIEVGMASEGDPTARSEGERFQRREDGATVDRPGWTRMDSTYR